MARIHATRTKMSGKKKAAVIVALALTAALMAGGAFAFTDMGQNFINRFRGSANPDILLHDDFEPGVNKDVYVENTGEAPMIVRVQFAEYLQIGNTVITGGNATDRTTWIVRDDWDQPSHENNSAAWPLITSVTAHDNLPANNTGSLPTQNRHIWYMTGREKVFKPGTGEMGDYTYTAGQTFPDGTVAKWTLPASPVVLMATYLADKANFDAAYPNGMWVLDVDGYCYWTQILQPGDATNLLLDNVLLDKAQTPDDNYYYAIDVRLEATNVTEAYKLFEGNSGGTNVGGSHHDQKANGKTGTASGEEVVSGIASSAIAANVSSISVKTSGNFAIAKGGTVVLDSTAGTETFTATVTGTNLGTKTGVTWGLGTVTPANGGVQINPTTGVLTYPANYVGKVTVIATSTAVTTKTFEFTASIKIDNGFALKEYETDPSKIDNANLPSTITPVPGYMHSFLRYDVYPDTNLDTFTSNFEDSTVKYNSKYPLSAILNDTTTPVTAVNVKSFTATGGNGFTAAGPGNTVKQEWAISNGGLMVAFCPDFNTYLATAAAAFPGGRSAFYATLRFEFTVTFTQGGLESKEFVIKTEIQNPNITITL